MLQFYFVMRISNVVTFTISMTERHFFQLKCSQRWKFQLLILRGYICRYILAECSRVALQYIDGEANSDYINAVFVHVCTGDQIYIARTRCCRNQLIIIAAKHNFILGLPWKKLFHRYTKSFAKYHQRLLATCSFTENFHDCLVE